MVDNRHKSPIIELKVNKTKANMPTKNPKKMDSSAKDTYKFRKRDLLKHASSFSRAHLLIVVAVFAAVGGYILYRSLATAPLVASLEAEQMVLPAGGSVVTDSMASAGKAVKLASNGTASGSVNFPSSVTSLTVMAKGVQCNGAPTMNVALDGNALLSGKSVSATYWNSYSVSPANSVAAGTHNLSISFTNNNSYSKRHNRTTTTCSRDLYLDVSNFYGSIVVTPPPTVALSASPTSVAAGAASMLTWNSANAATCTASGAWSGPQPTSGSTSTGALNQNSTYNLTCTGTGGSTTASATVAIGPALTACSASNTGWQNFPVSAQTGSFTASFYVVPSAQNIDGVTGFSSGSAATWTDLATIVRFNSNNTIDVRNGADYAALTPITYIAGQTYKVRMVVNLTNHSYDVYITPPNDNKEVQIASNFAFRTEQLAASSLSNWSINSTVGSHQVCSMTVNGATSSPPPPTQTSNCFAAPRSCGYPDPAAGNVGVPVGTTLTPSGSITVNTPGTVIDGLDVTGKIQINANNVTIKNTRVTQTGVSGQTGVQAIGIAAGVTGVSIQDVECRNSGVAIEACFATSAGASWTLTRVYFHGCADCVETYGSGTVTDSYIITDLMQPGDHVEPIYVSGTGGLVSVKHSTLFNPQVQTAVLFVDSYTGQAHGSISDSLIAGGGWTTYSGVDLTNVREARCLSAAVSASNGGTACSGGADSHGYWPGGGYFGANTPCPPNMSTWSNVIWDDNSAPLSC